MDPREILVLKAAEDVKESAIKGNEEICVQKLSELEGHLDNFGREDDRDEVQDYIKRIELNDESDNLLELVAFMDSIVGKFIGQKFSDLTPTDTMILDKSNIDMEYLVEKGLVEKEGLEMVQREDILDNDPDHVVQEHIISRFDLDIKTENIDHELKLLLSYLSLEYIAVLEYVSDELSNIKSKVSDAAEDRDEQLEEINEELHNAADILEEIVEDDPVGSPDSSPRAQEIAEELSEENHSDIPDLPDRPPRVQEELEDK